MFRFLSLMLGMVAVVVGGWLFLGHYQIELHEEGVKLAQRKDQERLQLETIGQHLRDLKLPKGIQGEKTRDFLNQKWDDLVGQLDRAYEGVLDTKASKAVGRQYESLKEKAAAQYRKLADAFSHGELSFENFTQKAHDLFLDLKQKVDALLR